MKIVRYDSRGDLQTKYLIDLESPSSLTRIFNLHIGTILNCETIVTKCIEFNKEAESFIIMLLKNEWNEAFG